jgi:hypothetical protein
MDDAGKSRMATRRAPLGIQRDAASMRARSTEAPRKAECPAGVLALGGSVLAADGIVVRRRYVQAAAPTMANTIGFTIERRRMPIVLRVTSCTPTQNHPVRTWTTTPNNPRADRAVRSPAAVKGHAQTAL